MSEHRNIRVQVVSDLHTELNGLDAFKDKVLWTDADLIIVAGDVANAPNQVAVLEELLPPLTPVVFLNGNHEYYSNGLSIDESLRQTRMMTERLSTPERPFIFLENDIHDITIRGVDVRLAGATLWTDFKIKRNHKSSRLDVYSGLNDYRAIADLRAAGKMGARHGRGKDGAAMAATELVVHRFEESAAFLERVLQMEHQGPTIIVTHHLPSAQSVPLKFINHELTPGFASNLDHLVENGATMWVHGHTHSNCCWRARGGTLVVCNPAGYGPRENLEFNPKMVVEMKSDRYGWVADVEQGYQSAFGPVEP